MTIFGLGIDTCLSTSNVIRGSGRVVEKSGILLQIKKAATISDNNLTFHVFSLEDAIFHLATSHPNEI